MEAFDLPGLWNITPYGAIVGMVVFLFLSLARGWLIPRSSHEREMAGAIKRGDEWKEVAEGREELYTVVLGQNTVLIEASKVSAEFYGTVMRDGGGRHVAQTHSPDS